MMNRLSRITVLLGVVLVNPAWAVSQVSSEQMQLSFGEQGQLLSAQVCHPDCTQSSARRLVLANDNGLIQFDHHTEGSWKLTEAVTDRDHSLMYQGPAGQSLRWTVARTGYGIQLETQGLGEVTLMADEKFRAREAAGFGEWLEQVRYLAITPGNVLQISLDDLEVAEVDTEWVGYRSRFWTVLLTADDPLTYTLQTAENNLDPLLASRGAAEVVNWQIYLGPVEPTALADADELLPDLMYAGLWFWLRWICIFLALLLAWIQSLVLSWGFSIMLLSVGVGFMMLPLTRMADRVQQQVNRTEAQLAPALGRIKSEFKGEQQANEIMALYKSEGVHPLYSLKSLLGVAIVIPVFIGAFDMLAENINLLNTSFLWIDDLSTSDQFAQMPFKLPFFGSDLNLLPFLMTGLSVWASLLHKPLALQAELRQKQVRNMILLAAAFFVLFYTFPAGMVLYWTTNNLISVVKSLWSSWSVRQLRASL